MGERPDRLERLPQQYFTALLGRVSAEAAKDGEPLVNFGRGNPEVGPPEHVIEAAQRAVADERSHGYPEFRGMPELKEAVAQRYRDVYRVELDPPTEVAVVPGNEDGAGRALPRARRARRHRAAPGSRLPGLLLGGRPLGCDARCVTARAARVVPDFDAAPPARAVYLNYPSNPCAVCVAGGAFAAAVEYAERYGAAVVHDFAYGDLVFDRREPESFLATPGAKDVGVEMFSMSKSYGMAGWRLGFVVGSAEIVERINLFQDHHRAGVFRGVQEAGIAALTGPQASVDERRARYEARRDRVLGELPVTATSEGTFYVWIELPPGLTAERLLTEHRLALAPGEGFGANGEGWARISLAVTDDVFELGLERLSKALL